MKTAFSTVACMGSDWKSVLAWATAARQDAVAIRVESDGSAFGASSDGVKEIADSFRQDSAQTVKRPDPYKINILIN